ncbi:MAG: hypothetical protein LBH58_10355 [Tannerellaceae bacterium]|jgi:CRISPR/Cas system Type II protein with McrA/HNH and RuvC-like nuclease domain|nr:hypothetical protein [Tannerellaceae bacterium]
MGRILGLDFGSNSIDWAIVDTEKREVVNIGCKIYKKSVDEINVNGITVLDKSNKKAIKGLMSSSKIRIFFLRNQSFSILFFLQIITFFLMLINLHDWKFWFNISFAVLLTLLSSANKIQK